MEAVLTKINVLFEPQVSTWGKVAQNPPIFFCQNKARWFFNLLKHLILALFEFSHQ